MKKIILSCVAVATLGFAEGTTVQPTQTNIDETGFYVGLGLSAMSTSDSAISMNIFDIKQGQDRLGNINLIAGYIVNDYIAVEGRYATTFSDKDRVELDNSWSLFVKPFYKFEDDFWAVYALLGYGNTKIEGTNGAIADVDDGGFQWGIGVSYTFRNNSDKEEYPYEGSWTIFADYTSVGNDLSGLYYNGATSVDADAFTIGMSYKF